MTSVMMRYMVAGFVAFAIYFPWIIVSKEFMYFLIALCFIAASQSLLLFRKLKSPWNITNLVAPLMMGIFLLVYASFK